MTCPNVLVTSNLRWTGRSTGFVTGNSAQSISSGSYVELSTYYNGTATTNGSVSFSSGRFTVSAPGTYVISATALFPTDANDKVLYVTKNGSTSTSDKFGILTVAPTSPYTALSTTVSLDLVASDYVSVWVMQTSGSPVLMSTTVGGFFTITQL
jgi:hypothetical protein